ncbi:MAG: class F sortase [Actinomycetota bacterium]
MAADDHAGGPRYDPTLVVPRLPPPTGPAAMTRPRPPPTGVRRALRATVGMIGSVLLVTGLLSVGVAAANHLGPSVASATVGALYGDDLVDDRAPLADGDGAIAPADSVDPSVDPTIAEPDLAAERPEPVGIQISSIDVSRFPIRAVGLTDDGALEVPDETEIGWYRYGATAGSSGATVLAAHVAWNGQSGPFFELGRLEPGASIEVTLDDGSSRHYEVVERALYGKSELPRERIWRQTGDETLVLITCGGEFNPEIRRFRQNIVVYAVPAA